MSYSNKTESEIKLLKEAKRIRNTKRWVETRREVLMRDNNRCRVCGKLNSQVYSLTVHHIMKITDNPSTHFDKNNLITLCAKCHSDVEKTNKTFYDKNFKRIPTEQYLFNLINEKGL